MNDVAQPVRDQARAPATRPAAAPSKPRSAYAALSSQTWYATSLICWVFAFFVFGLPGVWKVGLIDGWLDRASSWMVMLFLPPEMAYRWLPFPLFRWGHLLVSGLWVLAAPLQLHPGLRRNYPAVHRWSGRVMLLGSLSIIGSVLYWDVIGRLSDHGIHAWTFYRPTWIAFTASAALGARAALQRKYHTHAEWMILHVAAGMPFGWGRAMAPAFRWIYQATGLFDMNDPAQAHAGFWTLVYTSVVLSYAIAVYAIASARASARGAAASVPQKAANGAVNNGVANGVHNGTANGVHKKVV